MFGFGIALMHIADYFTRRKYDKKERLVKVRKNIKGKKENNATHAEIILTAIWH
jgi:hypothetical protein